MKSLFVFMIVLTTIACTNVEKIYFSCNEDYTDCTQLENDPRPDNTLDNKDAEGLVENGDNENVAVNDDDEVINEEDTEPDGDSFFPDEENPEEILPDEDLFVDLCVNMADNNKESMDGNYKKADDINGSTIVLTIILTSQTEKNNCLICFYSDTILELNGLCIEATTMPINGLPLKFNNEDCTLYSHFTDIYNVLRIEISRNSDLETVFVQDFLHL